MRVIDASFKIPTRHLGKVEVSIWGSIDNDRDVPVITILELTITYPKYKIRQKPDYVNSRPGYWEFLDVDGVLHHLTLTYVPDRNEVAGSWYVRGDLITQFVLSTKALGE